jgi:hypothetical protein
MTPGVMFVAGMLVKVATCGSVGLVLSTAVRWFHNYELKAKKKLGGEENDVHFENLRQRVRESRNVQ